MVWWAVAPLYPRSRVQDKTSYLADPDFGALPDVLRLILSRLLQKERGKRPSNAAMVATLLSKLEDS